MTDVPTPEWTALLTKLGIPSAPASARTDADRRVDRMLPRVSESAPDIEIALALLTAAASGPLRKSLGEIHTRSSTERAALLERAADSPRRRPGPVARLLTRIGLREPGAAPTIELDARVHGETVLAIAAAPESQLDRAAALDGVRRLFARGRLPADRAEGILRALHHVG
jgi:hypothetical protein